MSENNNVLFRNSVNGYNKSDVNAYIMSINKELDDADKKSSEAKKELEEIKAVFEEMKASISEQEAIISAQYETINKLNEEISALKEAKEDTSVPETAIYDQMSSKIGNVLIDAKKSADEIIQNAKNEADEYLTRTGDAISHASEKALKNITVDMCDGVDGCYKEATAYMNALQIEVNKLLSEFSSKNKAMNERIKALHSALSKNISSEINSLSDAKRAVNPYIRTEDKKYEI